MNIVNGTKPDNSVGVRDELDVSHLTKECLNEIWASTFPTLSKRQLKKFRKYLSLGNIVVYGTSK